jgi:hypothetical protein
VSEQHSLELDVFQRLRALALERAQLHPIDLAPDTDPDAWLGLLESTAIWAAPDGRGLSRRRGNRYTNRRCGRLQEHARPPAQRLIRHARIGAARRCAGQLRNDPLERLNPGARRRRFGHELVVVTAHHELQLSLSADSVAGRELAHRSATNARRDRDTNRNLHNGKDKAEREHALSVRGGARSDPTAQRDERPAECDATAPAVTERGPGAASMLGDRRRSSRHNPPGHASRAPTSRCGPHCAVSSRLQETPLRSTRASTFTANSHRSGSTKSRTGSTVATCVRTDRWPPADKRTQDSAVRHGAVLVPSHKPTDVDPMKAVADHVDELLPALGRPGS